MDDLEKTIRDMFYDTGELDRDEVTCILLELLDRIKKLEAAHGIKGAA